MAQLVSVNVGVAQHIAGFKPLTGIVKQPVPTAVVGRLGIEGDAICDRRHHGGADQAVYLYFEDDYEWWIQQGVAATPGRFGENLTIGGTSSAQTAIGDRFSIGDVLLEVTYHRTPCMTFAARMGDPMWVKRFHRANRPGAYCRVITPGTVTVGQAVSITPFGGERVTVSELMALDGVKSLPSDFMRRALKTPIREQTRVRYEERLTQLF